MNNDGGHWSGVMETNQSYTIIIIIVINIIIIKKKRNRKLKNRQNSTITFAEELVLQKKEKARLGLRCQLCYHFFI